MCIIILNSNFPCRQQGLELAQLGLSEKTLINQHVELDNSSYFFNSHIFYFPLVLNPILIYYMY